LRNFQKLSIKNTTKLGNFPLSDDFLEIFLSLRRKCNTFIVENSVTLCENVLFWDLFVSPKFWDHFIFA